MPEIPMPAPREYCFAYADGSMTPWRPLPTDGSAIQPPTSAVYVVTRAPLRELSGLEKQGR